MSLADVLQVITLLFTICGGLFAVCKWRSDKAVERASRLEALRSKFYDFKPDEIVKKMGSGLSENGVSLERESVDDTIDETTRKSFFSFLAHICYLMDAKVISRREFAFFKWQIDKILGSANVFDALSSLFKDVSYQRDEDKPFYALVKFAVRNCSPEVSYKYRKLQSGESLLRENDALDLRSGHEDKSSITIGDSREYYTHLDVLNGIFNLGYLAHMRGAAKLDNGDIVWFPLFDEKTPASDRDRWYNVLNQDGTEIYEYMPTSFNGNDSGVIGKRYYVFGKTKNVNNKWVYRFNGIFEFDKTDIENRIRTYRRISESFKKPQFTKPDNVNG